MSKYLTSVTEVYRVDTESEVEILLNETKEDKRYELKKYNCQYKEKKVKGEIEDTYYLVSLTKIFNDVKEPISEIRVKYE